MSDSQSILHPTDFSEPARYALSLADSLARGQDARLILLHVPAPLSAAAERRQVGHRVVGRPFEKLWRRLEKIRLEAPGVSVEHRLAPGDPATEILRTARETGCALIVMGTQGRRGLARLVMGSVAEQVVRGGPCPVVTVRAPLPGPAPAEVASAANQPPAAGVMRTILHPTDFSPPCEEAFRMACSLARAQTARLILLHVAEPAPPPPSTTLPRSVRPASGRPAVLPEPPPPKFSTALAAPLPAKERKGLEEMLRRLEVSARGLQVNSQLLEGDPATRIVDAAQAAGCDLIVMGTQGRTGLGRLLLGSVAERVLRSAPCPVVTVKEGNA
jgi:nucleotide-binding universal stress UspA family protein